LSPLLESQRDHLAAGVALEVDLGADGLREAPARSPLKRCSSAARTSSLLMAKAGVAQNMAAEKTRSRARLVSPPERQP